MDTAILIVHTTLYLLLGAFNFALIGRQPEGDNRRSGTASAAFLYGLFTIAFMLWWETPDLTSLCAKYFMLGFMWVPWLIDLKDINKPYRVLTTVTVVLASVFIAIRIAVVLAFWH
jgi:hypothetical protein